MVKYTLTVEKAHELTEWAAEPQAVAWCNTHGEIDRAARNGEEICAVYDRGRFDIVAGDSFCKLQNEPMLAWLAIQGFDAPEG